MRPSCSNIKNQQVIIDYLERDQIFGVPLLLQIVSLNMKKWFSPICLSFFSPFFFFYNTLLYYNLLNIHLLPFRLKLLKFKYRAIFITEEYVKQ